MRHGRRSRPLPVAVPAIASATLAVAVLAMVPGTPGVLQVPAGVLLVLVCPGAAFVLALRLLDSIGAATSALVVPGFGIAVTILLGLVLNLLPGGITRVSMGSGLLVVTAVLLTIASTAERSSPATVPDWLSHANRGRPPARAVTGLLLAAALAVSALVVATTGEDRARREVTYSQLWLLPAADPGQVIVGIRSEESTTASFTVQLGLRGQSPLGTWSATLDRGDSWQQVVAVPPESSAVPVEAQLFRAGDQVAYREVHLTLPATRQASEDNP